MLFKLPFVIGCGSKTILLYFSFSPRVMRVFIPHEIYIELGPWQGGRKGTQRNFVKTKES